MILKKKEDFFLQRTGFQLKYVLLCSNFEMRKLQAALRFSIYQENTCQNFGVLTYLSIFTLWLNYSVRLLVSDK